MQKQNITKKNTEHEKCKYLKINLLTKCLHNNNEIHALNSVVL